MITASQSSTAVVKYYGRIGVVGHRDPEYSLLLNKLMTVSQEVVQTASKTKSQHWKGMESDICALLNGLLAPDRSIRRFQYELLMDGLLPYLSTIQNRLHTDSNRFRQVGAIINAIAPLSTDSSGDSFSDSNHPHPAPTLLQLDGIADDIRANTSSYLFRSELLQILEGVTSKQWQPILIEYKKMLQNVGVKLLVVGIVASVAWPLAFLYPLYKLSISLLQIIHSWEHSKRLNPQSLFELAQMLVMLYAVSRLVAILSVYSSVGYSSCLLGAILLGVSVNPSLIKQGSAVMAPHMTQMDRVLEHADVLLNYDKLMHALTTTASSSSSSSNTSFLFATPININTQSVPRSSEPQYSARVEELRDETVTPASARAGAVSARAGAVSASASVQASSGSSTYVVKEVDSDEEDAAMEEFNIDHFDGGVIDLTGDTSSHQHSTNTIRLRRRSSLLA